jgi:hypothetical protein
MEINIHWIDHLDIPCCAATSPVDLLGLLCSATLTASMFSGEHQDEIRRHLLSNTEPSLYIALKEASHCVWKWVWNCLRVTTTLLFQWRTTLFSCIVLQEFFLCHLSSANWPQSRNSMTLARSGRVRTNLHHLLLPYYKTSFISWLNV